MDEILVEALNQTPEGQAYAGLPEGASDEDTQTAWNAFTQALETGYHARLQSAAAGDAAATSAVTALTTYTSTTSRLAAGQIPEFKDEAQILAAAPPGQDAYVTQVLPAKMRLNLRDVRDFSIGRDLRTALEEIPPPDEKFIADVAGAVNFVTHERTGPREDAQF